MKNSKARSRIAIFGGLTAVLTGASMRMKGSILGYIFLGIATLFLGITIYLLIKMHLENKVNKS